jgi:hypothetical protein
MPFILENNVASCQASPTVIGNTPVLTAPTTSTGTGLTPAQLALLISALQIEVDPTALKKAGLTAGKLLFSGLNAATTGAVVESIISQIVLEAQLAAVYNNPLTLDARLTAIETTQNDVRVVATLPTTGQLLDVLYVVTTGVNKNKSFYWDGTQWNQADKDVESFATTAAFPATGVDGVLYISKTGATKGAYYWDGTVYQPTTTVTAPLPTTNTLTGTGSSLTSTVNGVPAVLTPPLGQDTSYLGFDTTGNLVKTNRVIEYNPTTAPNVQMAVQPNALTSTMVGYSGGKATVDYTLPPTGNFVGQIYTFRNEDGSPAVIKTTNSTMTADLVVPIGNVTPQSALWMWNGLKWVYLNPTPPVPAFLAVKPILPGASLTFTHNANNEFCPLALMVKDVTNNSLRVDMAQGTNAINENIRVVRTANTVVITNLDPVNTIEVDGRAN